MGNWAQLYADLTAQAQAGQPLELLGQRLRRLLPELCRRRPLETVSRRSAHHA
ncbi:MAG: hypothetical protein ACLUNO_12720 [Oscillospiraceae bacterium]